MNELNNPSGYNFEILITEDDEIIHKDLKTAIAACVKYEDEIFRLQCKLGVTVKRPSIWDEDLTSAEYYDADGKQRTYYL